MKKVLFVCVENSCRSQMAKGFFNHLSMDGSADSAGTQPAVTVNPTAIKVMNEVDIDISQEQPKLMNSQMNNEFDYIVAMGCIDGCALTSKHKTIEWNISDSQGKDIGFYRSIRNQIDDNVRKLINEVM